MTWRNNKTVEELQVDGIRSHLGEPICLEITVNRMKKQVVHLMKNCDRKWHRKVTILSCVLPGLEPRLKT